MATNIANKVLEMRAYVERARSQDGEIGLTDLRAFARKRWPDLDPVLREKIVQSYPDTLME